MTAQACCKSACSSKAGFSRARLFVLGTRTSQKVVILEPELFRLQTRWETFFQKCTQLCHSTAKWQGNRHVDHTKISCVMRMHDCHRILKPSKAPPPSVEQALQCRPFRVAPRVHLVFITEPNQTLQLTNKWSISLVWSCLLMWTSLKVKSNQWVLRVKNLKSRTKARLGTNFVKTICYHSTHKRSQ